MGAGMAGPTRIMIWPRIDPICRHLNFLGYERDQLMMARQCVYGMLVAFVCAVGIAVCSAATTRNDVHTYGHYDGAALHCTAEFDHWPGVYEFHACNQVCTDNATVAVLD